MKILVTGSSGFVGRALCEALCAEQYNVLAVMRSKSAVVDSCVEPIVMGHISADTDWRSVLLNVDVVVHLAARVHVMQDDASDPLAEFRKMNVDTTLKLASQAAIAGVRRFVYVSSIKVNGESTRGVPFTEHDTPHPQDAYALSKWEAEQALHHLAASTGMEVVIVRPPLVYGPGVKANFASLLNVVSMRIPLPLLSIVNKRSMVYVGNLVDALIRCVVHPNAAGKTYLISDQINVSTPQLVREISQALQYPNLVFPFPVWLLHLIAKLLRRSEVVNRLTESLEIDASAISNDLAWQAPLTMQDGIKETVKWFMLNKKSKYN